MNKQDIINNWDLYYKSYLKLNPDLTLSGISSKRSLLNHFVKYGYDEGRPYCENNQINPTQFTNTLEPNKSNEFVQTNSNGKIYLEERMIIEKIDLKL
jgi:hypothetical protein